MSDSRVIFITGATDGLGRGLAHRLAAEGATLIVHGRDQAKLDCTADFIRDTHRVNRPRTVLGDLAELAQVRRLAAEVQADTGRLDVFVSNAGIGPGNPDGRTRRTSVDGYELRFAVNYLAGFLLTSELLPLLRASAPARVVNVSSTGQYPLEFSDLMLENGYNGTRAYGQSKLAQIMSGFELLPSYPRPRSPSTVCIRLPICQPRWCSPSSVAASTPSKKASRPRTGWSPIQPSPTRPANSSTARVRPGPILRRTTRTPARSCGFVACN
jgi:NAD(P)-dependent dehydrogenase (short-subunit alcohol dehydrogenase family)